ncbi:MAG TPA: NAD(P)-dependent oxidoreductase [Gaiellaceae bacterium]|nr:NAD(P)-dependent oxidoreductase [Gaiellaceae bacterium]
MTTAPVSVDRFEELRPALPGSEALVEADRCLACGGPYAEAPCVTACPADVDVPAFVTAIAEGDAVAAARTILAENLLGGTCARVCPVELLCEGACVLVHEGQRPVSIAALQRHATDVAHAQGLVPRAVPAERRPHRIAVIGAGPAGLVCAGELAALGYRVTVYDGRPEVGGLVRFGIAPYRQQCEPLPREAQMLESLGVEFRLGEPIDSPEALRRIEDEADAVFLGVGLGQDVDPELPGSDLHGVWRSLDFVEALKTGDPPAVGSRAVVIGGGNTAVDVAREALRLGAEVVTLAYRRTEAEMPAYAHEVDEAREEGVAFHWLAAPTRFLGEHHLTGVECSLMQLGKPDASGRRRPEPVASSAFVLPADTAIVAIGQQPRRDLLAWIDGLELKGGRIAVDPETGRTGNDKYFAGGDGVNGGSTVVQAVREAKLAARAIHARLGGGAT